MHRRIRNPRVSVAVGVIVGLAIVPAIHFAEASAPPLPMAGRQGLTLPVTPLDLGRCEWREQMIVHIDVTNDTRAWRRLSVRECCPQCVLLAETELFLPPQTSCQLPIRIDATSSQGRKQHRLTFLDSGGEIGSLSLVLMVDGAWSIAPDALDFGALVTDVGAPDVCRTVRYDAAPDRLAWIEDIGMPDWLVVRVASTDSPGVEVEFQVRPSALPLGPNSADVIFQTECREKPRGVVFVQAYGKSSVDIRPSRVCLVGPDAVEVVGTHPDGTRAVLRAIQYPRELLSIRTSAAGGVFVSRNAAMHFEQPVAIELQDDRGGVRRIIVQEFPDRGAPNASVP